MIKFKFRSTPMPATPPIFNEAFVKLQTGWQVKPFSFRLDAARNPGICHPTDRSDAVELASRKGRVFAHHELAIVAHTALKLGVSKEFLWRGGLVWVCG